jgi:hypothetical protein
MTKEPDLYATLIAMAREANAKQAEEIIISDT